MNKKQNIIQDQKIKYLKQTNMEKIKMIKSSEVDKVLINIV